MRRRRAVWLAAATLAMIPAGVALSGPGQVVANAHRGASRLLPDLTPIGPGPAFLCQEKRRAIQHRDACTGSGQTVLRVNTISGNSGVGPLVLAAVGRRQDRPRDCHHDGQHDIDGDGRPDDNDVIVKQRIYLDKDSDGLFDRSVDRKTSSRKVRCRYYHPIHNHFHLAAFATFKLKSVETGRIVRRSGKVSFCINDTQSFDLSRPGAQQPINGHGYYLSGRCIPRDGDPGSVGRLGRHLRVQDAWPGAQRHGTAGRRLLRDLEDRPGRPHRRDQRTEQHGELRLPHRSGRGPTERPADPRPGVRRVRPVGSLGGPKLRSSGSGLGRLVDRFLPPGSALPASPPRIRGVLAGTPWKRQVIPLDTERR
jgi:hypothetical protein